ncbi:ArsR/SmtB family transcription factor [Celeribacter indicus]|nr:metalloregulator ArsR/SmtB family transcription factor [Celeribacter indicus]
MATDQLSKTFAALADPTRRAILAQLSEGEATVSQLAAPFDMSMPSVSKHLKVLERAGLVSKNANGPARWCRLETEPLRDIHAWAEIYRAFWDGGLSKLATHLQEDPNG